MKCAKIILGSKSHNLIAVKLKGFRVTYAYTLYASSFYWLVYSTARQTKIFKHSAYDVWCIESWRRRYSCNRELTDCGGLLTSYSRMSAWRLQLLLKLAMKSSSSTNSKQVPLHASLQIEFHVRHTPLLSLVAHESNRRCGRLLDVPEKLIIVFCQYYCNSYGTLELKFAWHFRYHHKSISQLSYK